MSNNDSGLRDEHVAERSSLELTPLQKIATALIVVIVVLLGIQIVQLTSESTSTLQSIVDSDDATGNAFFTQRETLVLAVDYERWLSGYETKRNVLVRRALLGQRLNVRASDGLSNAERAHPEYLDALLQIDSCLENTPNGTLPEVQRVAVRSRCGEALDVLIFEARQLAIDISNAGDGRMREVVKADRRERRNQLGWTLLTIGGLALVAAYLGVSRVLALRRARSDIARDRQVLDDARNSLTAVESELQTRVARENLRRAQDQRLDSAVRMIASDLRRATSARQIVERLARGLEYAMNSDLSYVQLFASQDDVEIGCLVRDGEPAIFRPQEVGIDRELSAEMLGMVQDAWRSSETTLIRVDDLSAQVSDNMMSMIGQLDLPENSLLIPMGEGNTVVGFVIIGRRKDLAWQSNEIVATQNAVAYASNAVGALRSSALVQQVLANEEVVAELRDLDRLKNEFVSNVNHELRTPLTSIIGYLDVISDDSDDLPPTTVSFLNVVRRNADRLLELIEQLLIVSRSEDATSAVKFADVDFGRLVADTVANVRAKDPESTVTIETSIEPPSIHMTGDRLRLEQIVVNLVTNAVKFSPDYSTVRVGVRPITDDNGASAVELRVVDSGIGIPSDEIPQLFDRFFRASNAERALIPGTGLGLPIVKRFVSDHHGSITVESTVDVGTTMIVRLPLELVRNQ